MNSLNVRTLPFGFAGMEILIPDPTEVRENYERAGGHGVFPYWSRIWPSSAVMADWIGTRPGVFQGKRVLELGAGLGLPSFAASRWAKSVVASDLSPDAVEWMKFNADRLKVGNMRVEQLNWASDTLPAADILLLSDVGYNAGDFDDLKRLISTAVSEGAVIVLAVPSRGISPSFIDLVSGFSRERQICHHNGTDVLLMILGENSIRIE